VDGARGRDARTNLILATVLASARPSPQAAARPPCTPAAPLASQTSTARTVGSTSSSARRRRNC
jgi:hypothetical protein